MSEPFIAEIRIFAGNFAPRGWAFCDGQLLPISQNTALFSLIGTTYGGDGRTTTGLPDLQGRLAMHPGRGPNLTSRRLGEKTGSSSVTLTEQQIPKHQHTLRGTSATAEGFPDGGIPADNKSLAKSSGGNPYQTDTTSSLVDMANQSVATAGGSQSHTNLQPYLALNYIIALAGLYPSRG